MNENWLFDLPDNILDEVVSLASGSAIRCVSKAVRYLHDTKLRSMRVYGYCEGQTREDFIRFLTVYEGSLRSIFVQCIPPPLVPPRTWSFNSVDVSLLCNFRQLSHLTIGSAKGSYYMALDLSPLSVLQSLCSLEMRVLSKKGKGIMALTQLTSLDLKRSWDWDPDYTGLTVFVKLQHFRMSYSFDSEELPEFPTSLVSLSLTIPTVDFQWNIFPALQALVGLTRLTAMGGDNMQGITELLVLTNLQVLVLNNFWQVKDFRPLLGLPNLHILDVSRAGRSQILDLHHALPSSSTIKIFGECDSFISGDIEDFERTDSLSSDEGHDS